jgi:hypothetical protein
VQVRRHLESEDCLVTGGARAPSTGRPSATLSNSALLRPLRSRATCKNAGLHSGERVIADKDEVSVTDDDSAVSAALGRLWAVDHRKPSDTSGHSRVGSPLVITGYSPSSVLKLSF